MLLQPVSSSTRLFLNYRLGAPSPSSSSPGILTLLPCPLLSLSSLYVKPRVEDVYASFKFAYNESITVCKLEGNTHVLHTWSLRSQLGPSATWLHTCGEENSASEKDSEGLVRGGQRLRDCFDTTDWEALCNRYDVDINSLTDCMTDDIHFCVQSAVSSRRVQCFPQQQTLGEFWDQNPTGWKEEGFQIRGQRGTEESPEGDQAGNKEREKQLQEETGAAAGAEQHQGCLDRYEENIWSWKRWKKKARPRRAGLFDWANIINDYFCHFESGPALPQTCLLHHHPSPMTKAIVSDGISSRVLKDCADQLCGVVMYIFNRSLTLERVPVLWKTSFLPLFLLQL